MTQIVLPPYGSERGQPVPPLITEHAGTLLSDRWGDLSILAAPPEQFGADTTGSANVFTDLPDATEEEATELGQAAADARPGSISENYPKEAAVGSVAMSAIHYAQPNTEWPLKPLPRPQSAFYVDVKGVGAVHIETHQNK